MIYNEHKVLEEQNVENSSDGLPKQVNALPTRLFFINYSDYFTLYKKL